MPKIKNHVMTYEERVQLVSGGLLRLDDAADFLCISRSALDKIIRDQELAYVVILSGDKRIPRNALIKYASDRFVLNEKPGTTETIETIETTTPEIASTKGE